MKKRFFSVALCAVLALGFAATAAGCGGSEDEDLNSFTIFVPCEVPDGYTSYNELPVYQELEKRTGMKVTYVHGVYNDIQQMWTGDYEEYDVMMLSDAQVGASYPGGQEKGVSDGVLWDLTPYMEECMPDYLEAIDASYESVQKFTKTDESNRVGIYNVPISEQGPWYGFVVREDWLRIYEEAEGIIEKDGELVDLVTYDDWEAYLTYVKDNLNGGKAPLFLYYTGTDMVGTLNAGFDVSSGLYLKGGTEVAYGAIQPEYQQYLEKMKDWYEKGLIIMVKNGMESVNDAICEAAQIDGAGHVRILMQIMLPLTTSFIATVVLFNAIGHWNSWVNASMFISASHKDLYPLQLIMRDILINNSTEGVVSPSGYPISFYLPSLRVVMVIVGSLPLIVLYPFMQKYFEKGIIIGGVKG